MNVESDRWMVLWLEHFFKHAVLVTTLSHGWCVYREPVDWDQDFYNKKYLTHKKTAPKSAVLFY